MERLLVGREFCRVVMAGLAGSGITGFQAGFSGLRVWGGAGFTFRERGGSDSRH